MPLSRPINSSLRPYASVRSSVRPVTQTCSTVTMFCQYRPIPEIIPIKTGHIGQGIIRRGGSDRSRSCAPVEFTNQKWTRSKRRTFSVGLTSLSVLPLLPSPPPPTRASGSCVATPGCCRIWSVNSLRIELIDSHRTPCWSARLSRIGQDVRPTDRPPRSPPPPPW